MDDRTTTDFHRTLPLDLPASAPMSKSVPRKRRSLRWLLFLVVAAGVGWWWMNRPVPQAPQQQRRADFAATMPVVAATAETGDIDITLTALGTVTSLATVTIRSQISGYLIRVAYEEGQVVKKGDLLAEIDSRPYQLAL